MVFDQKIHFFLTFLGSPKGVKTIFEKKTPPKNFSDTLTENRLLLELSTIYHLSIRPLSNFYDSLILVMCSPVEQIVFIFKRHTQQVCDMI